MAWNEEAVKARIKNRDFKSTEVTITDLVKGKDFFSLGTKEGRKVFGSHVYIDVPNYNELVGNCKNDKEKQKKIVRGINTLKRVQDDILKDQSLELIQVQSARTHAINYRPFSDDSKLTENSVVSAISHLTYIYEGFNVVFDDLDNFRSAIGISTGDFLLVKVGVQGQREVISLGDAANKGAKIIAGSGNIIICKRTYDLLPDDLQDLFEKNGNNTYKASGVRWSKHPTLKDKYAKDFDIDALIGITRDYKESLPLADINISKPTVEIDFESLTEKNCKRFEGLVIFADLDGFSSYIKKAQDNDELENIVRVIHGIVAEFQSAVKDIGGLPVQVRGDCLISVLHLPYDDEETAKRAELAVKVATALQSSMVELNEYFDEYPDLKVAIGVESGLSIATRLGKQGKKERVVIGLPPIESETIQQKFAEGGDTRITEKVYKELEDEKLKKHFKKQVTDDYRAKNLTFEVLDEDSKEDSKNESRTSKLKPGKIVVGSSATAASSQAHVNSYSHCWND